MIEQVKVTKDMIRRAQKLKAEWNGRLRYINEMPITLFASILETTDIGKELGHKPSPIVQSDFVDYSEPSDKRSLDDQFGEDGQALTIAVVAAVLAVVVGFWVSI